VARTTTPNAHGSQAVAPALYLYALVEAGDPEAIDVYLCEQDAQQALEDCLRDEPEACSFTLETQGRS